ncbi:MAG: class I SAM-dependent methyltransferase, partial [Anaerolineae bacterium]
MRCSALGVEVVGLDPSRVMLSRAREKTGNDVQAAFYQVDEPFLRIPYPDACFDAV